jgi:oxygen-independent coproporphyrinogen-3 oxidase
MAGIYVHIPYCRHACTYCDFHFSVNRQSSGAMVQALVKEAHLQRDELQQPVSTLYFGGGTPSVLSETEVNHLMSGLRKAYDLERVEEFTVEANPEDITEAMLDIWQRAGMNRLSIGIQVFDSGMLQWMNRHHSPQQAIDAVYRAKKAGISNITVDLIFGLPDQDLAHWQAQLEQVIDLDVPHISVYGLSVEEKTVLHRQVTDGIIRLPEDHFAEMFITAHNTLSGAGFGHYEISNYARPGWESRHNSAYWNGTEYLGLGPSAHSWCRGQRWWNISSNAGYIQALQKDTLRAAYEAASANTVWNEWVMLQLRQSRGITADVLATLEDDDRKLLIDVRSTLDDRWFEAGPDIRLSPLGMVFSDSVMAAMMKV